MGRIRRFGVATILAGVMAVTLGTTVQAASKKPGGGKDVCTYLSAVINYPYITPTILAWALGLWNYYDCE